MEASISNSRKLPHLLEIIKYYLHVWVINRCLSHEEQQIHLHLNVEAEKIYIETDWCNQDFLIITIFCPGEWLLRSSVFIESTVKKALEFNFDNGYRQCIPSILKIPFLGFFQDICKPPHWRFSYTIAQLYEILYSNYLWF